MESPRCPPLAAAILALAAGLGCAAGSDDTASDTARDATPDDAGSEFPACDPAACDADCVAGGSLGGNCRDGACVCLGGADADADAGDDAGVDGGADGGADADADAETDAARAYTCIRGCRNGSEVCDDEGFRVPSPYVPMTLVCVSGRGGTIYVATNTGPPCLDDGVPRCRGWEERGENAWDYLEYVVQFDCTEDGRTWDIDLSAHAGEALYVGVHDDPDLGRSTMMTEVCVATWD